MTPERPNSNATTFAWPPRGPMAPDVELRSAPEQGATKNHNRGIHLSRLRAAMTDFESFWLAPTHIPIAQRMREDHWQADSCDAYCDRCGASIGPFEASEFGCADCDGTRPPWSRFVRLGAYDNELSEWITDLKFAGRRDAGAAIGRALGAAIRNAGCPLENTVVVPVSMPALRKVVRPIDHANEIAHHVAATLRAPKVIAFKRSLRPPQRSASATERRRNVRGSFRPRRGVDFTGWRVIVVDDVKTTGATMHEACRFLRRMGAQEIWACVAAVTPSPGRRGQVASDGHATSP